MTNSTQTTNPEPVMPLLAFTNTAVTHTALLAAMREHRAQDRIIQGTYGNQHGACDVGCAFRSVAALTGRSRVPSEGLHAAMAKATNVPEVIWRLKDRIFEGLSATKAPDFAVASLAAIKPGADLSGVWPRFAARVLREIVLPGAGEAASVVERVAHGYETEWGDDTPQAAQTAAEVEALTGRAGRTAADVAWAAAAARAAEAAAAAAWAAASAGRETAYRRMSVILIDELQACEVLS